MPCGFCHKQIEVVWNDALRLVQTMSRPMMSSTISHEYIETVQCIHIKNLQSKRLNVWL